MAFVLFFIYQIYLLLNRKAVVGRWYDIPFFPMAIVVKKCCRFSVAAAFFQIHEQLSLKFFIAIYVSNNCVCFKNVFTISDYLLTFYPHHATIIGLCKRNKKRECGKRQKQCVLRAGGGKKEGKENIP